MKSTTIKTLRTKLDLNPHAFAAVLGVAVSTVYRWESDKVGYKIDPLQNRILVALIPKASASLGDKIRKNLVEHGPLVALSKMLEDIL
jgi:transcriptional regulator with XRE-family HTH domain